MEETRRALLLLSGGVDSALCARMLVGRGVRVDCLFVDYGQVAAEAELHAARRVSALLDLTLRERRLEGAPARGDGEHVGRNALLVAAAAFEAGGEPAEVVLGIHDGSGYYDCSPRFVELMDGLLREQSDGRIALAAPLLHWSKQEILSAFAGSGLPLEATHSCERSNQPCGLCRSCLDRRTS